MHTTFTNGRLLSSCRSRRATGRLDAWICRRVITMPHNDEGRTTVYDPCTADTDFHIHQWPYVDNIAPCFDCITEYRFRHRHDLLSTLRPMCVGSTRYRFCHVVDIIFMISRF